jgi:hypothetical protein
VAVNHFLVAMKQILLLAGLLAIACPNPAMAQNYNTSKTKTELKYNLSPDGSKYVKATFLNQVWVRWNESNPGTLVNGKPQDNTLDIGLRRTRMQLYGQVSDHVFFYTQFGMNNFNFLSQNAGNRKLQAFFHDALGEYKVFRDNDKLKLGGGLTVTTGLSRFTQPSIGSIMTTDVPVFLQATVDQTDEFARKLSMYARGQVGNIDYRIALSDPFPIQTNGIPTPPISNDAQFTPRGHTLQYSGFLMYNFFDKEPHTTPYMAGTYLGDKKVLNLEAGVIYQNEANWRLNGIDTVYDNMLLWSVAGFLDMPVMDNKYAVSAYLGYFDTYYGENYIRNNGIMNPANGNANPANFNGAGNAYPMFGTGSSVYAQLGFRLPKNLLGNGQTLLPYVSYRWSQYDKLDDALQVYDAGVSWLMNKHQSKLSLNYQLRPLYTTQAGSIQHTGNASSAWLQYQVSL